MKIVAIWDIHWRDVRKKIVAKENEYDHIIFIWDYFDSWDLDVDTQFKNFNDILEFKKGKYNVTMILWNHDSSYLTYRPMECSWYNAYTKMLLWNTMDDLISSWDIKLCKEIDWILFSHAWISKTWYWNKVWYVADVINKRFKDDFMSFTFNWTNPYWDDITQWPLWIRPHSLLKDNLDVKQVVGHTEQVLSMWDITFIDSLIHWEYLVIEDWKYFTRNIKHDKTTRRRDIKHTETGDPQ